MAISTLTHNQTVPSASWSIEHNFGSAVIVDVTIGGEVVLPLTVEEVDLNNILITFTTPQTGTARLCAKAL